MRVRWMVTTTMVVGLLLTVAASPVFADVTGGCDGQAVIDGVTYTPANDSASNPIVVPDTDGVTIPWEGSAPFDNNGHHGELRLHLGPATIKVADWADDDPSAPNGAGADGVYALDDFREQLPFAVRGLYRVSGTHSADAGTCAGFVMLRFDGPTLGSPVAAGAAGMGALGLLVVAVAAVVTHAAATSGRARGRQLLGLAGGLVAGVAVAVLLQQASVWPLDALSSIGLPLLAALLGLLAARWAPFGRGRLATAAMTGDAPAPPVDGDADGYRWVEGRELQEELERHREPDRYGTGIKELFEEALEDADGQQGPEPPNQVGPTPELERRVLEQQREIRETIQQDTEGRSELQQAAPGLGDILGSDASPSADLLDEDRSGRLSDEEVRRIRDIVHPDDQATPDEPPDDDDFDPDDLTPIVPLS